MNFLHIILVSVVATIVWADTVGLFAKVNSTYLPLFSHPYSFNGDIINYLVFQDSPVNHTIKFTFKSEHIFTNETSTPGKVGFDDDILAVGPANEAIKWKFVNETRVLDALFHSCQFPNEVEHYLYKEALSEICFKVEVHLLPLEKEIASSMNNGSEKNHTAEPEHHLEGAFLKPQYTTNNTSDYSNKTISEDKSSNHTTNQTLVDDGAKMKFDKEPKTDGQSNHKSEEEESRGKYEISSEGVGDEEKSDLLGTIYHIDLDNDGESYSSDDAANREKKAVISESSHEKDVSNFDVSDIHETISSEETNLEELHHSFGTPVHENSETAQPESKSNRSEKEFGSVDFSSLSQKNELNKSSTIVILPNTRSEQRNFFAVADVSYHAPEPHVANYTSTKISGHPSASKSLDFSMPNITRVFRFSTHTFGGSTCLKITNASNSSVRTQSSSSSGDFKSGSKYALNTIGFNVSQETSAVSNEVSSTSKGVSLTSKDISSTPRNISSTSKVMPSSSKKKSPTLTRASMTSRIGGINSNETFSTATICTKCENASVINTWKTYTDYTTYCPEETTVTITLCEEKCVPSTVTVSTATTLTVTGVCIVADTTTVQDTATKHISVVAKGSSSIGSPRKTKEKNSFLKSTQVHSSQLNQKENFRPGEGQMSKLSQSQTSKPMKADTLKPTHANKPKQKTDYNSGEQTTQSVSKAFPKPKISSLINSASKNAIGACILGFAILL